MSDVRVVGLGAGGHARGLSEIVDQMPGCKLEGFIASDPGNSADSSVGRLWIGDDRVLPRMRERGVTHFFVAIGGVSDNEPRRRTFDHAVSLGLEPFTVRHAGAVVSPSTRLGPGCALLAGAIVGAGTTLEPNVLVNSAAVVEHDSVVGAHAHISIGARVSGGVRIGALAHIGASATILEGRSIGARAVVGAGAVVIADVAADTTVVGVPAKARS